MKLFFRKIHLWLSVPFGLIITLVSFSGATLVFEKEITSIVRNEQHSSEHTLQKQATEKENKNQSKRLPFFKTMFQLHRWLLDKPKHKGEMSWGKMIVGTSTLMFAISLISGAAIWIPRSKRALKNSLKIKRGRRFLHDIHVAGGIYMLIPLLLMSLTGLLWSFNWYRECVYILFAEETRQIRSIFFSIHTGNWGGITTRIIWFLSALLASTLPLSGYCLWYRRWRKRKQTDSKIHLQKLKL